MSFKVITADPPWSFGDKLPGKGRGAEKHYPVMTVDEVCQFNVPPTEPDAWLFMWRVSSQVEEAYRVVRAWGFTPKSEIVWEKVTRFGNPWFGMGRYVRASHETCIVAVKGKPKPRSASVRSRFSAVAREHSAKPVEFYDIVEKLSEGPYCELFSRSLRQGWTQFGNEVTW